MTEEINVKKMIRDLGGQKSVAEEHAKLAKEFGYKPLSINTINGWTSKNYLRWKRLPELFKIASVKNMKLDIERYIEGGNDGITGQDD